MLLKLKKKEELLSRQIHTKKPYRNVDSPLEYVSLFRNTLSAKKKLKIVILKRCRK